MSECKEAIPCKDRTKAKVRIYLYHDKNVEYDTTEMVNTKSQLIEILKYTPYQAETAMSFAVQRGKCLLYEGPFDEGVVYAQTLGFKNVNCSLHNVGNFK